MHFFVNSDFGKISNWEDFELVGMVSGSNFTINQCMYNPITRLIVIKAYWTGNGVSSGTAFARVPEKYKPNKVFFGTLHRINNDVESRTNMVAIDTEGNITQYASGNAISAEFSIIYHA